MVQNPSGMKTFAIRAIRGVLLGIFLGATTALCARGAWTAKEETEHGERASRLARLVAELEALDSAMAS
jgi:hypothetical protein